MLLLSFGCKENSPKTITLKDEFPTSNILKSKEVKIPVDLILASKLFILGDKIVIFDRKKTDIFKVFGLPQVNYLYSSGKYGEGPDEFNFIDPECINVSGDTLEILDKIKIKKYKIGDTSLIKAAEDKFFIPLSFPINRMLKVDDSMYFADNITQKKKSQEHVILNIKSNKVEKSFGEYPEGLDFNNGLEQYSTYIKSGVINKASKKFAAFYLFFNKFKIYDKQGILIKEVNIKGKNNEEFSSKNSKQNVMYRASPISTDKYIYVLSINSTKENFEKNIQDFHPKLQVWDWDGNPIAQFVLDKPIVSFSVSEKFNKIYGVSPVGMNQIYEFDMPTFLNKVEKKISSTKKISNDYFECSLMKDWQYSSATPEIEKNKISLSNGLKYNTNIFISPRTPSENGSSLWIDIISSPTKLTPEGYYSKYVKDIEHKEINYSQKIDTINDNIVHSSFFTSIDTLPNGKIFKNKHATWIWSEDKNIFEVKFSSPLNRYDLLLDDILASLKTINANKNQLQ
jgi:hypothetical protein